MKKVLALLVYFGSARHTWKQQRIMCAVLLIGVPTKVTP